MWRDQAACKTVDTDLFFDPHTEAEALAICAGCPVQQACLAEAWHTEHGVQGGMTADERRVHRERQWRQQRRQGPVPKELSDIKRRLLVQLVVPRTRTDLARLLERTDSYVGRLLRQLEADGLVVSTEGKLWPGRMGRSEVPRCWRRVA